MLEPTNVSRSSTMNETETTPASMGNVLAVDFQTHPAIYQHWILHVTGNIATLSLAVKEDGGIRPGYVLKLNSYDLGVDIELNDALNRIRFEYPEVQVVILSSARERMFCSGANIYMLGLSSHQWKVNFCKFTNETRNGMEDSSRHDGLRFLAAVNGACAGGGYELALACDQIEMVNDRSSTVSLPEVPLLGVLPGTGGLTRLTDKRRVRRDRADIFCTTSEGVRADRALAWGLIDGLAKPAEFAKHIATKSAQMAAECPAPHRGLGQLGVILPPLERQVDTLGYHYSSVDVQIDSARGVADIIVSAPTHTVEESPEAIRAVGGRWWWLRMARELDDAILNLRTSQTEIGIWQIKTSGSVESILQAEKILTDRIHDTVVRETVAYLRRTLARLEVSSRSLLAVIEPGSCFVGTLLELALAADRIYMLDAPLREDAPRIVVAPSNDGLYPAVHGQTRLSARFYQDPEPLARVRAAMNKPLLAEEADELGLVTLTPDELDWDEELRLVVEERASLSPDALTGMEASLRFGSGETQDTRIFGRLSAWQNWVFQRPNAVGKEGALKVFGTGRKPRYDRERV